jgi:nitrite reductase/ring-hydroxylating ferredoxin subunit
MAFVKAVETAEVPVGKMKKVELGGKEILIANVDGKYYAIPDMCTHRNGDLSMGSLEGKIVTCPLHGSQFDVMTGKSVRGPKALLTRGKTADEPTFEVKLEGKNVMVKID